MELLAPAGNIENFFTALAAGADAVYVGAPGLNARNLARDLRLEEIGGMIRYCRSRGKKLYVAANSLVLESELPKVVETLGLLQEMGPDALIVQDLGLLNVVRRYFPDLKLHASTLMTAHNSQSVELLGHLGCERVVLARELTLHEIEAIAAKTELELEVFIHGAMCFSYSGLCLFSSFLGGKSGLRGRCVQPCRRAYRVAGGGRQGGRAGGQASYLFSMNDLDGLQAVQQLRQIGVASLKIEGRLRSAHYVKSVVAAYRTVLDAAPADYDESLAQAQILLEQAMSRKVSSGYFFSPRPDDAVTPHHSGNLGLHLGRVTPSGGKTGPHLRLELKENLAIGDRLRAHLEPSGDRIAYTLQTLRVAGKAADRAVAGATVDIPLPQDIADKRWKYIDIYKIDTGVKETGWDIADLQLNAVKKELAQAKKRIGAHLRSVRWQVWESAATKGPGLVQQEGKGAGQRGGSAKKRGRPAKSLPLEWWLKCDSVKVLEHRLPFFPDRIVLTLDRRNAGQAGQIKRMLGKRIRNLIWALPPIIPERELRAYTKQIDLLLRTGFRAFQLAHISQLELFGGERVFLSADYTLNLLNSQSVLLAAQAGFESVQLAIEADRQGLQEAMQGYKQFGVSAKARDGRWRQTRLGLTVYGAPPLYISRLAAPFFPYDKTVVSPKDEQFVIRKKDGCTMTYPRQPFSLLPYLLELKGMGLDYVVVDVSGGHGGKKELQEVADRMAGAGRFRKLPTFNYLGRLV